MQANTHGTKKISIKKQRIVVFPFENPYYKGTEIQGIGTPFAGIFVSEIQSTGRMADLSKSSEFNSNDSIDINKSCQYAQDNGYDVAIIGNVTEWIDGATQWSGTVDVASLTINAYNSAQCELITSATGKQKGIHFTFVNAPTTRFYRPLSKKIVKALFQ